ACANFPSLRASAGACPCNRRLRGRARPWGPHSPRLTSGRPRNRSTSRAMPDRLLDRSDRSRRPERERSYPACRVSACNSARPRYQGCGPKNQAATAIVAATSCTDELTHDLGGIIHHRDHPRVIEPRRTDHAEDADDAAGAVAVGRDDGGGTREREQLVL